MAAKLKIDKINSTPGNDKLNEEWIEVVNEGDTPFNAEGCSITVAKGGVPNARLIATIKAGLVIKPEERVRLITGSAGKKTHGEPPAGTARNFHLFLKAPYLDRAGVVVRLMNRQIELCRADTAAAQ